MKKMSSCSGGGHGMYRRAKIFRRTGKRSFAVQLEGFPGVVEVHCTSEDWGYMARTWSDASELEDRMCTIGTPRMFVKDKRSGTVAAKKEKCARPIDFCEGVEIALGPYDPRRRAFVQCALRVSGDGACSVDDAAAADDGGLCATKNEDEAGTSKAEKESPVPIAKGRKLFRWSFGV